MALKSFRDLEVWQRSFDLALSVYRATMRFPADEKYGLTSQMRRAAVSVQANIAEGYRRSHRNDYIRFLEISSGSQAELESYLLIADRLEYLSKENFRELWELCERVGMMLTRLIASLRRGARSPKPEPRNPS